MFDAVLEALEPGEARDKLAGIKRFGEIELKKEHVGLLKPAVLAALATAGGAGVEAAVGAGGAEGSTRAVTALDAPAWLDEFLRLLDEVQCEPQVYAMGRRVS